MAKHKLTGYQLKEQISRWERRRNTAQQQFNHSLYFFDGDDKGDPKKFAEATLKAEKAIASLQTLQAQYNLAVKVKVQNDTVTLCEAIKLIGGVDRFKAMWAKAASAETEDRYGIGYNISRSIHEERAKRAVTIQDSISASETASSLHDALRAAIACGNAEEKELEVHDDLLT